MKVDSLKHLHYLHLSQADITDILCPKGYHLSGTTGDNAGTMGIRQIERKRKTKQNARFARISPTPVIPNPIPSLSAKLLNRLARPLIDPRTLTSS